MTAFAQLAREADMTKSSSGGNILRGLHNLVRDGLWKRVATKTRPGSFWGKASRLFHDPVTDKMTTLNKGLMGYGLGGMAAGFAGYDVPGSNLAMNASMPVLGALMTAPSLITAYRANRPGNRAKLQEDMLVGARGAGADMMSLGQMDSDYLTRPGLARQYLRKNDAATADLADQYSSKPYKPLSKLKYIQSLFEDPDTLINDSVDQRMHGLMLPQAMLKSGSFGKVFSHVFPWLFPTIGAGMLGHSILRDKPYDEQSARTRGYAGAQAKIQQGLDKMTGLERMALKMDPTLLADRIEKQLPGTIGTWEQQNGRRFQPGFLSGIARSWKKGGDTDYYQYDVNENRHYL